MPRSPAPDGRFLRWRQPDMERAIPAGVIARPERAASQRRVRSLIFAFYAAATALFNFIYVEYSSLTWGYMGLTDDLDAARLSAGLACLAGLVILLPTDTGPRSFFLHCFVLLYIMPAVSLFGYNNFPTFAFLCIIGAALVVEVVSAIPIDLPIGRSLSLKVYAVGTVGVTAALILALVAMGGLRTFNLDFNEVYTFRDEAAENLPGAFGYIIPMFTKTVIPFGIAAALHYRYRNFAALLVAASVILFGITSHKIMLFAPILVAITYLTITRVNPILVLIAGTTAILAAIAVAIIIYGTLPVTSFWGWVESLLIWRSFILPAYLDYEHIAFFAENNQYFWSTSQITFGLLDAPYNGVPIPQVIGYAVFNDPTMVANAGFIGNGYAQAGLFGVLLYAAGVGLVLSFIDSAAKALGSPFVIAASLTLVLTMLVSTDFVSMFLTHGLLLGLLLLLLLKPAGSDGAMAIRRRRAAQ